MILASSPWARRRTSRHVPALARSSRVLAGRHPGRGHDQLQAWRIHARLSGRLHVVERFSRSELDVLKYDLTIDDATPAPGPGRGASRSC